MPENEGQRSRPKKFSHTNTPGFNKHFKEVVGETVDNPIRRAFLKITGAHSGAQEMYAKTVLDAKLAHDKEMFEETTARQKAEYDAAHDALTGLPNRRLFEREAEVQMDIVNRNGGHRQLSLLVLDLDKFGAFNKDRGTPVGDRVLKDVATALKGSIRKSDTPCRWGGEELAALMPYAVDDPSTYNVDDGEVPQREWAHPAERVRREIKKVETGFEEDVVSASIGTTDYIPNEPFSRFFERADLGSSIAKALGRDQTLLVTQGAGNLLYIKNLTGRGEYTYHVDSKGRKLLMDDHSGHTYRIYYDPNKKDFKMEDAFYDKDSYTKSLPEDVAHDLDQFTTLLKQSPDLANNTMTLHAVGSSVYREERKQGSDFDVLWTGEFYDPEGGSPLERARNRFKMYERVFDRLYESLPEDQRPKVEKVEPFSLRDEDGLPESNGVFKIHTKNGRQIDIICNGMNVFLPSTDPSISLT